jgi:DNA-binding MarR family transcriptional regulator
MDGVRWLDEREAAAWRGLQTMQMQLNATLARELAADSELSYPDYMVLVALTDQPDGRRRPFELGHDLGWEKSRLSHHVSRMVARGLVVRDSCPGDQRGSFVVVSDKGRAAITAAAPGHVAAVRRYVIDRLTPAQLDALAEISASVMAALGETGDEPARCDGTDGDGTDGDGTDGDGGTGQATLGAGPRGNGARPDRTDGSER